MKPPQDLLLPTFRNWPTHSYQRAKASPLRFYVRYWALCICSLPCSVPALSISWNQASSQRLPSSTANLCHSQFIQHWHFLNCTVQTHRPGVLLKGQFFRKSEVGLSVCISPHSHSREMLLLLLHSSHSRGTISTRSKQATSRSQMRQSRLGKRRLLH